jgi:hypothetical protein
MFSNINDAWDRDPVKEMTNKLSNGAFKTQTDRAEIFNFKDGSNKINNARIGNKCESDNSIFSQSSLDLFSNSNLSPKKNKSHIGSSLEYTLDSDYSSYAPVNFKKKPYYSKSLIDSDLFSESITDSKCMYSVKHLKKCDGCYSKLKKMINQKVNKKFDEMMLDMKMKQIQTGMQIPNQIQSVPQYQSNPFSDSWKETLIIMIGALIALFMIFLIVRSLNK